MRVLQVAHGFPPEVVGGTERYVETLCRGLLAAGHDVRVVAGSLRYTGRTETETIEQDGLTVVRLRRGDLYFDSWDKAYHPHLERLLEAEFEAFRPALVHVHHWVRLTSTVVRTAARAGVPAVATMHDLYLTCPRVFRVREETVLCERELSAESCLRCVPRWTFQGDDEIRSSIEAYRDDVAGEAACLRVAIAPSLSHAAHLDRFQPALRGKLQVIPHPSLTAIAPAKRSAPGEKLRVACWSHLHPLKGQHLLLQALSRLGQPDRVAVDLYGDAFLDDYRERLHHLAEGFDVTFRGPYLPADLSRSVIDVAVIPTMARESYSFILDEAAALGPPVLAADAGALAERATERVRLFRRGDPTDLALKLQELIDDEPRRRRMERAPPPPTVSLQEHTARVLKIYERAVQEGAPLPPQDDARQRLLREWERRELGFRELLRSEKWEEVIAEQQRVIEALRRELELAGGQRSPTS
ncbi:MAG: glycosyltransferase [Planctomycetota bacterium]